MKHLPGMRTKINLKQQNVRNSVGIDVDELAGDLTFAPETGGLPA